MKAKQIKEFFDALNYITTEKGVQIDSLIKKLENAIILAVRKQYGKVEKIDVIIDPKNLNFDVSFSKLVVENVKNPANEILLEDALKINSGAKLGEYVKIDVDAKKIGRLAAQAAKQQILQGIREIERENVIEKIGDKIGRILTVKVEMLDPVFGNVIFKIDDSEVILFKNQQLINDNFAVGDLVKVYAIEVDSSSSGSLIKISRTHPNFVKSLFELEVPEIEEGKVIIKKVARQAGIRTKIAVYCEDENLDAVGCCIGSKGARIEAVVEELNGEKIDIINYSEDEKEFVRAALAPAEAKFVEIKEVKGLEKVAYVGVLSSQISLAIGVSGLNVKLAAMLVGCKIDVNSSDGLSKEDFKMLVENKFNERIAKYSQKGEEKKEFKTKEEVEEEEDIHALEVEKMLREAEKNAKLWEWKKSSC